MDGLNNSLNNHKYQKTKNNKKNFDPTMTCLLKKLLDSHKYNKNKKY